MIKTTIRLTETQMKALQDLSAALEDYQTQERVAEEIAKALVGFHNLPNHPRCPQWGGLATLKPLYIRSNGKR